MYESCITIFMNNVNDVQAAEWQSAADVLIRIGHEIRGVFEGVADATANRDTERVQELLTEIKGLEQFAKAITSSFHPSALAYTESRVKSSSRGLANKSGGSGDTRRGAADSSHDKGPTGDPGAATLAGDAAAAILADPGFLYGIANPAREVG